MEDMTPCPLSDKEEEVLIFDSNVENFFDNSIKCPTPLNPKKWLGQVIKKTNATKKQHWNSESEKNNGLDPVALQNQILVDLQQPIEQDFIKSILEGIVAALCNQAIASEYSHQLVGEGSLVEPILQLEKVSVHECILSFINALEHMWLAYNHNESSFSSVASFDLTCFRHL